MGSIAQLKSAIQEDLDVFVRWPTKALLLWRGCWRQQYHTYPPEITNVLRERGIYKRNWANDPAIHAFLLAGGKRPTKRNGHGWNIHHLYFGLPFPQRTATTIAVKDPLHFTQSAGLVAIHPIAEALAEEERGFTDMLREQAFQRFGYDPDCFFSSDPHDQLGFVKPYTCEVLFEGN